VGYIVCNHFSFYDDDDDDDDVIQEPYGMSIRAN